MLLTLGASVVVVLVAIGSGRLVLRVFRTGPLTAPEELLGAFGVGIGALMMGSYMLGMVGLLSKAGAVGLLSAMAVLAWHGLRDIRVGGPKALAPTLPLSEPLGGVIVATILGVLTLSALVTLAPLTGSDAMHYHFTVPRIWVELGRSQPVWWTVNSFFTGGGHYLTAFAMALHSDALARVIIYVGGVATAVGVYLLGARLAGRTAALTATLLFLVTPMTFWQMSVSGSPDTWATLFAALSLLFSLRSLECRRQGCFIIAGLFAGLCGCIKYTALALPIATSLAILLVGRSPQLALRFGMAAAVPILLFASRNFAWTGDPFFPYLASWLPSNHKINSWALEAVLNDTGHVFTRNLLSLLSLPFRQILQGETHGYGHYFGPLPLAAAPLILSVWRTGPRFRYVFIVTAVAYAAILAVSWYARYLFPLYPIALVLAVAASEISRQYVMTRKVSVIAVVIFLLFSIGADVRYAKDFVPTAVGLESQEAFLNRMAPDFQVARFVNETLRQRNGLTLVFFRHVYYLDVPFLYGDPGVSWLIDPVHDARPESLATRLADLKIRWVVKSGSYPQALVTTFEALERRGQLRLIASKIVTDFGGNRIFEKRTAIPVAIYEFSSTKIHRR
jgi:hypothetical protein